jgi:hypothetical protein
MKTNQMIAGISAAAVLAMVTPAYAGLLGAGAGAFGGSMAGAFDGRGAASTSFDRFPERTTPRIKPSASGAEPAQRSGVGAAKAVSGSAAHTTDGSIDTALGQASGQSSAVTSAAASKPLQPAPTAAKPASASKAAPSGTASRGEPPSTVSAMGAGSMDAQSSRGDNSVAVSGEGSESAARTQ